MKLILAEFNLPENSNIQKVEFGEGISFAKQENLIIFSGKGKIKTQVGSKNQIGKNIMNIPLWEKMDI